MGPNGSPSFCALDVEQLITDLLPKVSKAVRRIYRHPTNQDEIEDLVQDVLLKLIEDNYRRLRSFANRSKIETWLHTVVRHHVGLYLWKRQWEKENVNLGDLSLDALIYQPVQEEVLIDEDEWKVLNAIISGLPERKRLLLLLVILGLKPQEIAEEMGIKIGSVYAEKSALFKEIRELLEVRQSCLAKQLEKIP